jgi:hypothetical protein
VRKEDLKIRTKVRVFRVLRVHARRISRLQIVAPKMLQAAGHLGYFLPARLLALLVANYAPIPPLTDKQPI